MRIFGISIFLLSVFPCSSSAWAGGAGREVKERAARKACLTGDYAKGVDILADLFLDTGSIVHIFNQGRCLEQNRRYEDAVARFREYLVKGTDLSADDRADAEKHIALCESYLGKSEPEKVAAASPPAEASLPSAPVRPEPAPVATSAPASQVNAVPAEPTQVGGGLRTSGIVIASVGVASLAAGVVLNLKVNSMTSDLEKPNAYNRSTNSTRETYKIMGWVAYGVGGAAVAAGAVFYAIGLSKGTTNGDSAVSFAPSLASGVAGVTMTGAF
jgi:hypothetical protein